MPKPHEASRLNASTVTQLTKSKGWFVSASGNAGPNCLIPVTCRRLEKIGTGRSDAHRSAALRFDRSGVGFERGRLANGRKPVVCVTMPASKTNEESIGSLSPPIDWKV